MKDKDIKDKELKEDKKSLQPIITTTSIYSLQDKNLKFKILKYIEEPYFRNNPEYIKLWKELYNIDKNINILFLMKYKKISTYFEFLYLEISNYFLNRDIIVSKIILEEGIAMRAYKSDNIKKYLSVINEKIKNKKVNIKNKAYYHRILNPSSIYLFDKEWIERKVLFYNKSLFIVEGKEISFEEKRYLDERYEYIKNYNNKVKEFEVLKNDEIEDIKRVKHSDDKIIEDNKEEIDKESNNDEIIQKHSDDKIIEDNKEEIKQLDENNINTFILDGEKYFIISKYEKLFILYKKEEGNFYILSFIEEKDKILEEFLPKNYKIVKFEENEFILYKKTFFGTLRECLKVLSCKIIKMYILKELLKIYLIVESNELELNESEIFIDYNFNVRICKYKNINNLTLENDIKNICDEMINDSILNDKFKKLKIKTLYFKLKEFTVDNIKILNSKVKLFESLCKV